MTGNDAIGKKGRRCVALGAAAARKEEGQRGLARRASAARGKPAAIVRTWRRRRGAREERTTRK
jgi:hypothetical protein